MLRLAALARPILLVILYGWSAILLTVLCFVYPGFDHYERSRFSDMIYGKAYKPFVTRVLVPGLVRMTTEAIPDRFIPKLKHNLFPNTFSRGMNWTEQSIIEYYATFCWLGLAIFLTFFGLRSLIVAIYQVPAFISDLCPLAALVLIPAFFRANSYIYDFATVVTWTWAFVFLFKRNVWGFYITFILASLNKETSVLLIPLFVVLEYRYLSRSALAKYLGLLSLSFVLIRGVIFYVFINNPGGSLEFHLFDHNLKLLTNYGRLAYFLLWTLIWIWMIGSDWSSKPLLLRRSLFMVVLPLIVMTMFFGYIDEYRDYYEALPIMFLLSLPTVLRIEGNADIKINISEAPMTNEGAG
jgi:hypothetical protein